MIDLLENKKTFTVMSLNCQSVASKFDEVKIFIDEMMTHNCYIDVINLQETWLGDSSYYADFTIPGYDLYMQPHTCTPHGGLITYIKSSLKVTQLKTVYQRSNFWEAMFFALENMNKPLIIGNIYRPPRELIEPLTCFIEEFNTAINHNKIRGKKMILSGDFNINLLKISEKIMYANFFDMLTANSLLPNIACPTRITQTSATLIDNIFSNSLGDIVFSGIIANKSISDHQIIFSSFDSLTSLKLPMNAPTTSKFIDYDALKFEIKNSIYCKLNLNSDYDPNTNYNILESTLVTAIKKHTVIKQIKFNKFKHKKLLG